MHGGKLALQSPRSAKIHSTEKWTSVFIIFTSIYCRAHVSRFQQLLKYMHLVRLASSRCAVGNMGWKNYDEQFRLRKVSDPSSSWGVVDTELWLLYIGGGNTNTTSQLAGSGGISLTFEFEMLLLQLHWQLFSLGLSFRSFLFELWEDSSFN